MIKLAKTTVFSTAKPDKETVLDKTTRIVRRINDDEAQVRHVKTARLRKARFESEAEVSIEVAPATSKRSRKRR